MSSIPKVVLLIESSRASGRSLLTGVADYAHYHGPWSFYWEPAGLDCSQPWLKSLGADGIIMRDGDDLNSVLALGIPTVVVGHKRKEITGVVNVVTDSPHIGRMGAEHLLQCGFKHYAFVGYRAQASEAGSWSQVREESFARRIRESGRETENYLIQSDARRHWVRERTALAAWLKALPKPLGLMACNDDCGVQVMEACKSAGLVVPDQVGVIGADNDEIVCGLANPAMSSVAINFERAGFEAARALQQLMQGTKPLVLCSSTAEGGAPSRINVSATHVATRRSTDIVCIADPGLGRALRFIRDHARTAIGVNDVAKAAGFSRRALERRFRREIGISILDQIRQARTEQICRMLVETTLPVGRIAESLGFGDVQHFARYFRSARQYSPLSYRKAFARHAPTLQSNLHRQATAEDEPQNGDPFPRNGVAPFTIANQYARS